MPRLPPKTVSELVKRWDLAKNEDEVLREESGRLLESDLAFRMAVLVCRDDPRPRIERNSRIAVLATRPSGVIARAETVGSKLHERQDFVFRLTWDEHQGIAFLLCTSSNHVWRDGAQVVIDHLAPVARQPFLRQRDLRGIFDSMQASLPEGQRLRFRKVSSVRRLLRSASRRRYESDLRWTDLDYEDAFAEASEQLAYFRKLAFEVCEVGDSGRLPTSTGTLGTATSSGVFTINRWPDWLFQVAALKAAKRARDDHAFMGGRDRTASLRSKPRPIVAEFHEDISVAREDIPRLVSLLRNMPRTSVSVLHGNPYLHATVVDMNDGSALDVLLLSQRRMLVVPQVRATEDAVSRLCGFIYDQVGEADFRDEPCLTPQS